MESFMNFGQALEQLKAGKKVARQSWNDSGAKDQYFLFLVAGSKFKVNRAPLLGIYPEGTEIEYRAHVDIRTKSGKVGVYSYTHCDVLADDWFVID